MSVDKIEKSNEEIQKILEEALKEFEENDLKNDLRKFGKNISERSMMFRIAHYLANKMDQDDITVDCEYNRQGDNCKIMSLKPKTEDVSKECKRFFPDIVVHRRRKNEQNILVCEIKKEGDHRGDKDDKERLEILTDKKGGFRYQLGAFIKIDQSNTHIDVCYFKEGKHFKSVSIKDGVSTETSIE